MPAGWDARAGVGFTSTQNRSAADRVISSTKIMLCQTCSAYNDDDREFCFRCQNKLLVLSGVSAFEEDEIEDYEEQEDLSLDEHLLERVSGLEEIVKRTAETLRSMVEAVHKHERAIFVNQTGLLSTKEILEKKNVIS